MLSSTRRIARSTCHYFLKRSKRCSYNIFISHNKFSTTHTTDHRESSHPSSIHSAILHIEEESQHNNNNNKRWTDFPSHRDYFDLELRPRLNIKIHPDDWYRLRVRDIPGTILAQYGNSLSKALTAVYPEIEWHPWRFAQVPPHFWDDIENQRSYLRWLAKQPRPKDNTTTTNNNSDSSGSNNNDSDSDSDGDAIIARNWPEDWYQWNYAKLKRALQLQPPTSTSDNNDENNNNNSSLRGLDFIRKKYGGSLSKALIAAFPEYKWEPWLFYQVHRGYWDDPSHQRQYFDWLLSTKLSTNSSSSSSSSNKNNLELWYQFTEAEVRQKLKGTRSKIFGIITRIHGSLASALQVLYPEYPWEPWRFPTTRRNAWSDHDTLRRYIEHLAREFHVRQLDDWARVSPQAFLNNSSSNAAADSSSSSSNSGYSIIQKNGGLFSVLARLYPEHDWSKVSNLAQQQQQQRGKRSSQWWLRVCLSKLLLPNEEIIEDFVHPELRFRDSGDPVQLDLFVPSRMLALEYQGEQHFNDVSFFGPSTRMNYEQRDAEKRRLCSAAGIKLVHVPYWWDRTTVSLNEMITNDNY